MKCPNCGAEVAGNFCEYCGSQLQGQRPKCSKCGSTNITFKRENQGEIRGKSSKQVIHRTVGLCKDCGNTWYVSETAPSITPHKRKTWLWVLGWLFIFPLPLTVLIMRKRDMNAILKIFAIAASWIIYFSIGMAREKQDNQILNASDLSPAPIQVISTDTPNSVDEVPVAEVPANTESITENAKFSLSYDVAGEYGEPLTLNENTDMPISFIAFKIPGGVYDVSNKAAQGTAQITVYSGVEFDGQWEQFVSRDCDKPIVLQSGDVKSLTVQEGQFLKLNDGATDIEFVKTANVEKWEDRFLRTENDVIDYVDNTLTPEYEKRISTTMDYNLNEPGVYYVYVEILMAEDTPAYLRNSLKTIEERIHQAPYEMNVYLIYTKSQGEGLCSTALGNGFSDYSLMLKGQRYQYNSLDEIPDDLF